jgi:hypothetical protein
MATNTLTGSDTITINDRVLTDFGDGSVVNITFPNELVAVKTGKNGNAIYSLNETGRQADVELRILRGSEDDKFLNSLKINMESDIAAFTLLSGEFVKRIGDGLGNVNREIITLSGGVFSQNNDTQSNVEGDTEQALTVYRLRFSNGNKAIA